MCHSTCTSWHRGSWLWGRCLRDLLVLNNLSHQCSDSTKVWDSFPMWLGTTVVSFKALRSQEMHGWERRRCFLNSLPSRAVEGDTQSHLGHEALTQVVSPPCESCPSGLQTGQKLAFLSPFQISFLIICYYLYYSGGIGTVFSYCHYHVCGDLFSYLVTELKS